MLVERKPDEALEAREEDAALLEDVLVVERDVAQRAAAAAAVVAEAAERAASAASRPDPARLRTAMDIQLYPSLVPRLGNATYHWW